MLLAVAGALARRIRKNVRGPRVGIVLPPGAGALIANLAVGLAGRTPVNLNFTTGPAAAEASLRLAGIETVITADAMRQQLSRFPFPPETLDLRTEVAALGRPVVLGWLALVWLLPGALLARLLGVPHRGGREEAGLLFTSGSAGEPKGVVLTHRNLLANCAQISAVDLLPRTASLMACLPVFHSFGFTVTLWYPLLRGCRLITLPNPLEAGRIVETIAAERATVLVGAPTFLRPLLRRADPAQLRSLTLVVSGAEKLPVELYAAFFGKCGIEVIQGYGLTETSPVASVNLPDPAPAARTAGLAGGNRPGSVGRLLPGLTARITDPQTGRELPPTATGMLCLRGPNVFSGYLCDEAGTRGALQNGWFVTGDLARFDADGFLFIEGRLARFSKIGGEMVPHGTIEEKIIEVFGWGQVEGAVATVVGVPDAAKGEALVLLTDRTVTAGELREKLTAAGLPNLWIPKIIRPVDGIPLLGSGKCDLQKCREIAASMHDA